MVKVNNKFWIYFTPFFGVSIADFERVNVSWDAFSIYLKISLLWNLSFLFHSH